MKKKQPNGYAKLKQAYDVLAQRNDELTERLKADQSRNLRLEDALGIAGAEILARSNEILALRKAVAERDAIIGRLAVEGKLK